MKKNLFITTVLIIGIVNFFHAQSFQWTVQNNYSDQNIVESVGNDNSGNVYISGAFIPGYQHSAPTGCFIAKYSSTGNIIWTDTIMNVARIQSVTNSNGDTYATGYFNGNATFGSHTLTGSVPPYFTSGFIVKYNSTGQCIWAKNIMRAYAIVLNPDYGFFTTGSAGGTATTNGAIITKFDDNGNLKWNVWVNGGICRGTSVAVDLNGNVYTTGRFKDTVSFGSSIITYNGPNDNIFIAKYDSTGLFQWVKDLNPSFGFERNFTLSLDEKNDAYITGQFFQYLTFDTITYSSPGKTSSIIAKYSSSGSIVWTKALIGTYSNETYDVINDQQGHLYITGATGGVTDFGNNIVTNLPIYNMQAFTAKFDLNGNTNWIIHPHEGLTDPGGSFGRAVCKDKNNTIYMAGTVSGGDVIFGSKTLYTTQYHDVFLTQVKEPDIVTASSVANEVLINPSFIVYPNPNSGVFELKLTNINSSFLQVTITDASGKIIYRNANQKIKDNFIKEIDLNHHAKGIYFIEIITDDKRQAKKVVLE